MAVNSDSVIVVGAGIGGLSTALSLASKGIRVTLIEKHVSAGGKIRQVSVADKLIDAGPTVFTMRWVFENLFASAGFKFSEHVTLFESALLARHSWVGSEPLDLFNNIDRSAQAIEAFAGTSDAQAYRHFAKKSEDIFNTLNAPFMQSERPSPLSLTFANGIGGCINMAKTQPFVSLWTALSQSFSDPRLVQLFARYATYCGSSPLQAPATLMLIAHVERAGVWAIDGGMKALADALLEAVKSLGCECLFGHSVTNIITDSSGVTGVTLDSGETLRANSIVFNGDTQALTTGMLGADCAKAVPVQNAKSLSAVTRCEVATSRGFDLAHHNVFFGKDYPDEFNSIFKQQDVCDDPTVYVCAQDRLDEQRPVHDSPSYPQPERLFSLMNAPAHNLQDNEVASCCELMTNSLTAHGLELKDHQGAPHVETPNTFAKLFPATDGALYGRPTHGWMGSFNRPSTTSKVKGLYLAGGSVHPGAGVPMVALSGQIVAQRILSDRGAQT